MSQLDAPLLVARSHGMHVRGVHKAARTAEFVASTDSLDRYGEIVEQIWQLDNFRKNPVALFGHNTRSLPIGRVERVDVVGGELACTIRFLTADANPEAEHVWQCVLEGALNAVSVGFMPHSSRWEKRGDAEVLVLTDNELLEISVVPIPANPEALAKIRERAMAAAKAAQQMTVALARPEEKHMEEIASLKAVVSAKDAELAAVKAVADLAKEKHVAVEKDLADAKKSLDDMTTAFKAVSERAEKAETEMLTGIVDALIGKKLVPAERDAMLGLAKTNRDAFDAIVAARPEMPLLTNVSGKAGEALVERSLDGAGAADELAALALTGSGADEEEV